MGFAKKEKMEVAEKTAGEIMTALMQHVAVNSDDYELRTPKTALSYFFLASRMTETGKVTPCGSRRSVTYEVIEGDLVATLGTRLYAKYGQRTISVTKEEFCTIVQTVFRRNDLPVNAMTWRCWRQLAETLKRKQQVRHATRPYIHIVTMHKSNGHSHR